MCAVAMRRRRGSRDHNTKAMDQNTFLFVLRPKEARKVCLRKRDPGTGRLLIPDGGLLFNKDDGFNF